ncbi:hypothetical protein ABPG77_008837, partial [Micractinium sp. CCAP 211/92]
MSSHKYKKGDKVEVAGDPDDPGFAGSWWTGVVRSARAARQGRRADQPVTVRYDEILEDDGINRLEEEVLPARIRPACPDDSRSVSISDRRPGDPVDCWHDDGWWEGFVHRVWDDRISVYFPRSGNFRTAGAGAAGDGAARLDGSAGPRGSVSGEGQPGAEGSQPGRVSMASGGAAAPQQQQPQQQQPQQQQQQQPQQ